MQPSETPPHVALQFRHIMKSLRARGCPATAIFVFSSQMPSEARLLWLVAEEADLDIRTACISAARQAPRCILNNGHSTSVAFPFDVAGSDNQAICFVVEISPSELPALYAGMVLFGAVRNTESVADGLLSCASVVRSFLVAQFGDKSGHEIELLGISPQFRKLLDRIRTIGARDPLPVLISGERGSGKEAVALALHYYSRRRDKPFLSVNCAALTEQLHVAELFGCCKGAYTGADHDRKGKFALADGGTLFLDEITEMPPSLTAAMLRALDRGEIQPLGSGLTSRVDVRIIAATNKDIDVLINHGAFAADIFDRLAMFQIKVPALRERGEDIPILATYYAQKYCQRREQVRCSCLSCSPPGESTCITDGALKILRQYRWPGNIRELRNVVAQSITEAGGPVSHDFIPEHLQNSADVPPSRPEVVPSLSQATKEHIEQALRKTGGNKSATARLLGLPLSTLVSKMKRLGI